MVTIPIQFCHNEYFLLQNLFWYEESNSNIMLHFINQKRKLQTSMINKNRSTKCIL